MPAHINFQVLNVGQGSGNFVEVYKDGDVTPTTTVLIDLGSEGASSAHEGPSLERIVESLKSMAAPEIACLCLSHSDTDHISMILQLLAAFDPPGTDPATKPILTVKTAFYGGNSTLYSKRKGPNVLKSLKPYMPTGKKPSSFATNGSTYETKVPLYEDKALGFKVEVLIGNTTKAEEDDFDDSSKLPTVGGVNKNTVSLVVVFDWNNVQFITTGDATGITMLRANGIMTDAGGKFFPAPLMLTIPHHGSYTTAYDFTGQELSGIDEKTAAITLFARRCGAKLLTASAGRENKFKHPSAAILNIFWGFCTQTDIPWRSAGIGDRHFYTGYYARDYGMQLPQPTVAAAWPRQNEDGWYTLQSVVPVFTTDYFSRGKLTAYVEPPPKVPSSPLKKVKSEDKHYMGILPTSVIAPTPGTLTAIPDAKDYPAEEVGWNIAMATDKVYTLTPILPTTASIAALHALIANAERHYGWYASEDTGAAKTPAPTTAREHVMAPPPRPPARPSPPGSPRPRRR